MKAATAAVLQLELLVSGALGKTPGNTITGNAEKTSATATATGPLQSPATAKQLDDLIRSFATPPQADLPGGYWWWFNTLMNKAGITRDLTEFKAKGIGEVLMVNSAANMNNDPMPSGPRFLSDGWFDLYKFALAEANRLGITVGFNLCAGWCMGGPWIEPEESGRWYLQSRKEVTGPFKFSEKLPLPGNHAGYEDVRNPPGIKEYFDLPLAELDYRDTAVIAIPVPPDGNASFESERLELLPAKANRMDASNWTRADIIMDKPLTPWENKPADNPIPLNAIIDLTSKMQPDGQLDWDVPAGDWVIVRTGHRMTGSKVLLGLPGGEGLSIDWLNRRGVDKQFKHMGEAILAASKPYVGNTLAYFCDDSFEDGFPNWTDNIIDQFKKYRGYDPTPYLAAAAGYIVESAEVSDRFLNDYRKTVADCLADEHYTRFAELCHESGIQVQNEAAGPSRSGTMCMDGMKNLGRSDYPMGEFWLGKVYGQPNEEDWELGYGQTRLENGQNKVTKMVASAAHIYGRNLVSAESFTTTGRTPWLEDPASLRYAADRAFCEGVNRIMIHTMTASRPEDGKPGYEYYAGTHFNPNVTWWEQCGAFLTYMGRCQHLLRQGHFVADVLYYTGDWAPNLVPAKQVQPGLGKGYDYDACNEEVLLTRLSVEDGRIVLPDGMSYQALVLPDTTEMPVPVLKKIAQLVSDGATVIGPKPATDPGLKDYPACDAEVKRLAEELWADCDGKTVTSRKHGKGQIACGISEREILAKLGVHPDFDIANESSYVDFIHRRSDKADIYFILNRKREKQKLACKFRINSSNPVLFDPVSGKTRPLPQFNRDNGLTAITLEFEPRESYFVVFPITDEIPRDAANNDSRNFTNYKPLHKIDGPWNIKFDPAWGGPESTDFPELSDWSKHEDKRIRHYSGTATYSKTFTLPDSVKHDQNVMVDLGVVHNIADVSLNGIPMGTVWTNPWRVDITEHLKPGPNTLEVRVTNLWPNRLIGDAALPEDQRLTKTNISFKADGQLLPSGLMGPVTILVPA